MSDRIETEALQALAVLRGKVTDEDLHESGRYFADCCFDLTQCRHGETGEYRTREDGQAIALLWSLWRSGVIQHNATDRDLVIAHLGDLLAHQIAQSEAWRKAATDSLPVITGLRTELATARAEIERQREYIAGRDYEC